MNKKTSEEFAENNLSQVEVSLRGGGGGGVREDRGQRPYIIETMHSYTLPM